MTRDEHREKCIKAIAMAITAELFGVEGYFPLRKCAAAAFDALHGVAWVNSCHSNIRGPAVHPEDIFIAMAISGDLTNPPERKP